MKRKVLFILLLLFLFKNYSVAQTYSYVPFPDSNASWDTYDYITPMGKLISYSHHFFLSGDTILKGINYNKMYDTNIDQLFGFIRSDTSKRTYFLLYLSNLDNSGGRIDSIEQTIYDFSMEPGDILVDSALCNKCVGPPDYDLSVERVDSIKEITINNSLRKEFFLSISNTNPPFVYYTTVEWIEGIGSLITPTPSPQEYPYANPTLCKFTSNDTVFYQNNSTSCQSINGLISLGIEPDILVYPNPTYSFIEIKNQANSLVNASLYNSLGQKILTKQFSNELELSTDGVNSGIYFIQVTGLNGNSVTKKVIKL